MKSTRSFNTTNLIIFILLVGIQILSVHGQAKPVTATPIADIPFKCCNPRHMPVDGKCVEVDCRNDAFCDDRFKPYCTKFNGGQPFCRSRTCGCQGEAVRHSYNNNCPKDQKCYPDGKCGLINLKCANVNCPKNQKCNSDGKCVPNELKCTDPNGKKCLKGQRCDSDGKCEPIASKCRNEFEVLLKDKCIAVGCYRDAQCKTKEIQDYCAKFKMGKAFCRNGKSCGCQNQGKPDMTGKKIKCNRKLNASDDCPETEICYPQGFCAAPPKCAFYGEKCDRKTKRCCDGGVFCHKRKFASEYACLRTAFTGEPCGAANGGIPCDFGTRCVNGICSSSSLGDCYPECRSDQTCAIVKFADGSKRMCV